MENKNKSSRFVTRPKHPGTVMKERMKQLGISVVELCDILGCPAEHYLNSTQAFLDAEQIIENRGIPFYKGAVGTVFEILFWSNTKHNLIKTNLLGLTVDEWKDLQNQFDTYLYVKQTIERLKKEVSLEELMNVWNLLEEENKQDE